MSIPCLIALLVATAPSGVEAKSLARIASAEEVPNVSSPRKVKANVVLATCSACHDLTSGRKKLAGPPLFGIHGSEPVTPGLPFDRWTDETLDTWLSNPTKVLPGAQMTVSVPSLRKRHDTIEALKSLR